MVMVSGRVSNMAKCEDGCTCKKHEVYYRGGSRKCPPDCSCSKHTATSRSPKPPLKSQRCEPDCTCNRHSTENRRRISEAAKARGGHTDEHKRKISMGSRAAWASMSDEQREEISRTRSENAKKYWEREGLASDGPKRSYGGKNTSKHEKALIPYLAKLGYHHNTDNTIRIGRRAPDFIDLANRRIFEYFGSYWHPDPDEEQRVIAHYADKGWSCEVLWEQDLFKWLTSHKELVTEAEHDHAWRAALVNNGYRKPDPVGKVI